ncbi:VWA domain-containing protein [Granulosicoccus antarcticus]|uniref:VWFA domain-containing protein n=1 Tax=Granulosicoccus antarcticus IMCC3135 TaxID=1192854 RepID=A0A2Z2P0M6_9GAMM|nr:VWA domain-containing protein [Granulosicoccus antarcticus]ASJ75678.1 hypothetical protein IMCC3135_28130 [Granulosicoccus antarcticus IMCC3135]
MEFLFPIVFILLPLPWLVRRFAPAAPLSTNGALRVPFFRQLTHDGKPDNRRKPSRSWRLIGASLIWLLLLCAAARPVFVGDEISLPVESRDLMFAVDLSGSMAREDFTLDGQASDRLTVVKAAADDFITRRTGDRIGLVLFSDRAYLQAPLTLDRQVVRSLLDEAQVGLTGTQTAIGDAIAIAIKRLKDRPVQNRVLILMTDGASNAGVLSPMKAATLAKELGVRIYTIGVGAEQMVVQSSMGQRIVNPSEDLDEETLAAIASQTGGRYFRANDTSGLASVYKQLDKLEPVSADPVFVRPSVSLFFWPLAAAVLLTALMIISMLLPGMVAAFNKRGSTTSNTRRRSTGQAT